MIHACKIQKKIIVNMLHFQACLCTMALNVNNHVHEVLKILDDFDTKHEKIHKISDLAKQNTELHALLDDMRVSLTRIASSFLTSPVNGKAFIPLPPDSISMEEAKTSLLAQLGSFSS